MASGEEDLHEDDVRGRAPWLVTWADMMAVLLTFFIVLQAFSTVSERKFHEAMTSIQHAFDVTFPIRPPDIVRSFTPDRSAIDLETRITDANLDGVSVQDWGDRIILTVDTAFLFDRGQADLTESGRAMLDGLSSALTDSEGLIRIEGHTCDLPVAPQSRWRNNWWLSTARALTVLENLEGRGFSSERLSATGYGEHVPIAPNDGEANRARNRRVEFVVEKPGRRTD